MVSRTGGSGSVRVRGHVKIAEYSAWEKLKAHVSNELRIDTVLWYRLVGMWIGLLVSSVSSF